MHEFVLELRSQIVKSWRWRWLGMITCWVIAVIGTTYVILLPDVYESQTRVRVDVESALVPLMKGLAISSNVNDQVRIMQETLLSRPNLAKVARAVDLDLQVTTELEEQDLIESLRQRVKVRAQGKQLFDVSFVDTDPVRARDVVQSLLTIFIESNLGENRDEIMQAQTFIAAQLKEYEAKLAKAEEEMAVFKSQNMAILSDSQSFVERTRAAMRAVQEIDYKIGEAQVVRAQMASTLASVPKYNSVESAPPVIIDGQLVSSTYGQIQAARRERDTLLIKYTENHPDVLAVEKRMNLLIARYDREKSGDRLPNEDSVVNMSNVSNPIHEQLTLNIIEADQQLTILQSRRESAIASLEVLQKNAGIAPAIEVRMKALNRDYNTIKKNYEALLDKRESARLSRAIEASTDAVQFKIIDPPQVAAEPSGPARMIYLTLVLLFSFGAGGGTAFLRSQLEDTFSVPSKLNEAFGLPVIGSISQIANLATKTKSALGHTTFVVATAAPIILIVLAAILMPYFQGVRNIVGAALLGGFI